MKRKFGFYTVILITIFIGGVLFLTGCKEDPVVPTLTTVVVSNITRNTASTGGIIAENGGAEVTSRGVCFGTASLPEISGPHTSDSKGDGSFISDLTGLTPGIKYYVRAYATNEAGTAYGNEIFFSTMPLAVAELTTTNVTGITSSAAVSGGNITSDGGAAITIRGICWASTTNPTVSDSKTSNGSGTGSYTANITGLTPGSSYHVRAYATNSVGTSYGNDLPFTASAVTPTLTTAVISSPTRTTAVSGGNITDNGGAAVTARGVCWSISSGPLVTGSHTADGSGNGAFISNITGLSPGTTYYVRAYATNSAGTSYANEISFTTNPVQLPTLTTTTVTNVTTTTAASGGIITDDNGAPVTLRGVCWNTSGNPTTSDSHTSNGTGTGSFSSSINGLTAETVYYVRAYATNSAGTGYGNQVRFSTSVADIDGNVYRTVVIGTQLWMQSDLKTTRYNDNQIIPNVTGNAEWAALISPAYCWYGNNSSYGSTYGILYNWHTVGTAKLCPAGWHVPSDTEFGTLELFLGLASDQIDVWGWRGTTQGAQIKDANGWDGTNTSGFSALPGGYRYGADGSFSSIGIITYWWSSTLDGTDLAWYRRLDGNNSGIYRASTSLKGGKFIRCIKN